MASLRPRSDRDGDEETLPDGTVVTHRFASIDGVRAHFVTAGGPTSRTVVVLHGLPETWWAWHSQIRALAAAHHVVAVDMCGHGQSDTRTDIDCSPAGGAARLLGLLDHLHVDRFHVIAHDRGAVLADHLCGVPGANSRMVSYVRMQQSGSEPHSEPGRHTRSLRTLCRDRSSSSRSGSSTWPFGTGSLRSQSLRPSLNA